MRNLERCFLKHQVSASDEGLSRQISFATDAFLVVVFIKERIMQKLKALPGIFTIGLMAAVSVSAQNSGTFYGQAIQPDGKILIWGSNLVVSGVPSGMVARLNSNGSRDASFNFCGCEFTSSNNGEHFIIKLPIIRIF